MTIEAFIHPLGDISKLPLTTKIKIFGWYIHEVVGQQRFSSREINACFDAVHIARPTNTSSMLRGMTLTRPQQTLRDAKGFRLSSSSRAEMAQALPVRPTAVLATGLLKGLVERVNEPAQKTFLLETLVCFTNEAYRAAIVMAWNLAYSHVCDYIYTKHLAAFNAQLKIVKPKSGPIVKPSDFEDHRESTVIEVARGASILSAASAKTLTEKLNKRNTAAHPSSTIVKSVTAEEVIHDLVENILLRAVL